MKRSDFLALIPALSAIPLIGKNIVQKPDKIEIYQPEQVKDFIAPPNDDSYLAVVHKGRIVATGYMTNLMIYAPLLETTCRDNGGARTMIPYHQECTIEGVITGPFSEELVEAFHNK